MALTSLPLSPIFNCSGGEFDADRQMDDLKLLYKAYLAEALESGSLSDEKVRERGRVGFHTHNLTH